MSGGNSKDLGKHIKLDTSLGVKYRNCNDFRHWALPLTPTFSFESKYSLNAISREELKSCYTTDPVPTA